MHKDNSAYKDNRAYIVGKNVSSVNIVELETEEVAESFEQLSRRSAEKLSRGISINLNHEEFYVDIIEK